MGQPGNCSGRQPTRGRKEFSEIIVNRVPANRGLHTRLLTFVAKCKYVPLWPNYAAISSGRRRRRRGEEEGEEEEKTSSTATTCYFLSTCVTRTRNYNRRHEVSDRSVDNRLSGAIRNDSASSGEVGIVQFHKLSAK